MSKFFIYISDFTWNTTGCSVPKLYIS